MRWYRKRVAPAPVVRTIDNRRQDISHSTLCGTEIRHLVGVNADAYHSQRRPFAQDRQPGQAQLKRLKGDPFEQPVLAVDRLVPFAVVVGAY